MKKTLFTIVMTAILICAMAFCASALEDYAPVDNSYNITYNVGEANAGEMYGMVAVVATGEDYVINESSIVYIDQATADASGNITFSGFAPMGVAPNDAAYVESRVFIGGAGYDTAEAIGTLKAATTSGGEDTTTYKITGTVTDTKSSALATVTVKDGDTVVKTGAADATGAYDITLDAAGTYSVTFSKPGFCTYTYTDVVVDGEKALGAVNITALIGDVNKTGEVNGVDLTNLLSDFGKTSDFTYDSDVNATNEVNGVDLTDLLGGFGKTNVSVAFEN